MSHTIKLPVGGIVIKRTLDGEVSITSQLHKGGDAYPKISLDISLDRAMYDSTIDGLETLILAHALAGIDVQDTKYVAGIQTAIDDITQNCYLYYTSVDTEAGSQNT